MANLRADNLTGTGGRNAIDGSVAFTSSTGYLSTTIDAIGTGDFTIEWWFKAENRSEPGTANRRMFRLGDNNATGSMSINYDAVNNDIQWNYDAATILAASTIKVYDNSWYHIAAVREGTGSNETKLYINGVLSDSVTLTTNFSQTALQIGWDSTLGDDFGFYGNISNLRVTKSAVYTAAFTPPTEKYSGITDTILLCCQDSDDPTQESTGKTITGYASLQKVTGDDTDLVTNGDFNSDISGWTNAQGTWAWNSGKAHMTGTSGNSLEQNVTTVVGKRYRLTATVDNTANVAYNVGITFGGTQNYVASDTIQTASKTFTIDLIATSTSTLVDLWGGTAVTGYWSYASVKLLEPPKQPKVIPPVGVDEGVVFEGDTKVNSQGYMYFPTGDTTQRGRGRAVIGWANNPVNTGMDYFNIQSMGNSISFGTLTSGNRWGSHALSSSTRGLFVGGYINTPAATFFNTIDYVTIATTSNPIDFGDVTTASYRSGCCSSSTRGIIALGHVAPAFGIVNTIDQVTIASLGNATNFADLFQTRANMSSLSSPTRGVFAGGVTPTKVDTIDYVTIATAGDATDFGNLQAVVDSSMAMASTTRGIVGGGYPSPTNTNIINYITIATTGNASDFGDLTGLYSVGSATSNSIRGVFCGGYTSPSKHNLMEFVTIATTGNTSDFGDILYSRRDFGACSDSHGGLS